jgi:hypothetical protein
VDRPEIRHLCALALSFRQLMREATVYGVKPEEAEAIRKEVEQEGMER